MTNKQVDELTLTTDGADIERVNQFNVLDYTLISYLNKSKHIDKIAKRCSRTMAIMIKLEHIIKTRLQITLYTSIIWPHTNYYQLT